MATVIVLEDACNFVDVDDDAAEEVE